MSEPGATNEPTQPTPTPTPGSGGQAWGEWYEKIPTNVRAQLPEETLKTIQGGYMRDADYRQKTQEIARERERVQKFKDRDLERDIAELDQWRTWRDSPKGYRAIEARLKEIEAGGERGQGRQPRDGTDRGGDGPKTVQDITADDFLDDKRLQGVLDTFGRHVTEQSLGAFGKWYGEKEVPRLQEQADQYLALVTGVIDLVIDAVKAGKASELPNTRDLYRHMAATQQYDARKAYEALTTGRKSIEDPAYQRGLEEGRKLAAAQGTPPTPPPFSEGGRPSWSPPPGAPKNEEELFRAVMADVNAKHGPVPV